MLFIEHFLTYLKFRSNFLKQMSLIELGQLAQNSALKLQSLNHRARNELLQNLHSAIINNKDSILNANLLDIQENTEFNLESRLLLTSEKFDTMAQGILDVCALPDPLTPLWTKELDKNLTLYKMACPIGVLLVIFEARPEVVIQIASLCIKSGNACILKGGKESINTVKHFQEIIFSIFPKFKPVQFVHSREDVTKLLNLNQFIDLVIPRGSKQLVQHIQQISKISVLGHADGINCVFIDEFAELDKAIHCVIDSKTNYPSACNSVETLLIHENCSNQTVRAILAALIAHKVRIRATNEIISNFPDLLLEKATDADFDTEFLDLIIAVSYVPDIHAAIRHIHKHGSKHTDCIITENKANSNLFLKSVDSAGVYLNCSTRFADGYRYGFGAEIGVSTNKIHARGPVGLEGLLIYKYVLKGDGQGVVDYKNKTYSHGFIPTSDPFE
eukprot:NODE_518_length_7331_cov_0.450913.p1 type:complete len:445 gc:universal NODE_518_length_7331_cov_0.450913:1446-112(-)